MINPNTIQNLIVFHKSSLQRLAVVKITPKSITLMPWPGDVVSKQFSKVTGVKTFKITEKFKREYVLKQIES